MENIPDHIFRAYDIRGKCPGEITPAFAAALARAYIEKYHPKKMIVGRDARPTGEALLDEIRKTVRAAGVQIQSVGVVPVDVFYFAINHQKADGGIYISASHNPMAWNGFNLAGPGAQGISYATGLKEIKELMKSSSSSMVKRVNPKKEKITTTGEMNGIDIVATFIVYAKQHLFPIKKHFKIILDAGYGQSAGILEAVIKNAGLPVAVVRVAHNKFPIPEHAPNPLIPANQKKLKQLVKKESADFGVMWDLDGDRCFFVDEEGRFVHPYYAGALIAAEVLRETPGATVLKDHRLRYLMEEVIREGGGKSFFAKPGMTVIAGVMKEKKAAFAAEPSGHFFFSQTYFRDSGFLPVFYLLKYLDRYRRPLSSAVAGLRRRWSISDEMNFKMPATIDVPMFLDDLDRRYRTAAQTQTNRLEGLSIESRAWRANIRASNTEPLLRLNIEAKTPAILAAKTKELGGLIKKAARSRHLP